MKTVYFIASVFLLFCACSESAPIRFGPDWVKAWEVSSQKLKNPNDVVQISGSSTCAPILQVLASQLSQFGFNDAVDIEAIGTDAGIDRLIRFGEVDIVMASRTMTDQEIELVRKSGRTVVSFPLAVDALSIVVSPQTNFVRNLSLTQLQEVFTTARTWNEIDASFPDSPIYRFAQGRQSGSTDFFVNRVLGIPKDSFLASPRMQNSEDDSILARAIEKTFGGVGYLGYSEWKRATAKIQAVSIGGWKPDPRTVASGQYPLSRPLTLYTTVGALEGSSNVLATFIFLYSHYDQLIEEAGYIPLTEADLSAARERLKTYFSSAP